MKGNSTNFFYLVKKSNYVFINDSNL